MNGTPRIIVPVVEGPGDRSAVPILLRTILWEHFCKYDIGVDKTKSAKGKQKLIRDYEKFLRYASIEPSCAGIIVLLDADDECPVDEVTRLVERTKLLELRQPVTIVEANREYETWFVASLDSQRGSAIRGRLGIDDSESYRGDVEQVHAKSWLKRRMSRGRTYKETSDQAALSSLIDIEHTRCRSRSFQRLCHAVEELLCAIESGTPIVTPHTCGNGGCLPDAPAWHHRSR